MDFATLSRAQSRKLDALAVEQYGMSSLVLMENAGRGVADCLERLGIAGPVVVCCGKGNNAGDGFVLARHLDLRGYSVHVARFGNGDRLPNDAAANFEILRKCDIPIEQFDDPYLSERFAGLLSEAAWIVDALLGTGVQGEPRPPLDVVIDQINASPAPTLAVDVPSGLDCDSAAASIHTVRAAHTCTFAAAKPGLLEPEAAPYVGQLHVCDIGAPRKLLERLLAETL